MAPRPKPQAEVEIDEMLVRRLLQSQHPDLGDRPLGLVAEGWDNVLYRLGDDLAVRLPRRQTAADLVAHEHRWLPELAERLPLPIPAPVRVGKPGDSFGWAWSICRWFEGTSAATVAPGPDAPEQLGQFVAELHQAAPPEAPVNQYRGGPLSRRDAATRERIERLPIQVDRRAVKERWEEALAAPQFRGHKVWLHGDLHPGNLIVDGDGNLVAVIDLGDLTGGDPACDLAVSWMWFDGDTSRARFLAAAGVDQDDAALLARARGWALTIAVACLADSADAPEMAAVGRATLARLTGSGPAESAPSA
jgi:aminoglycoside phosphotransferase (APT) family kinase protein